MAGQVRGRANVASAQYLLKNPAHLSGRATLCNASPQLQDGPKPGPNP